MKKSVWGQPGRFSQGGDSNPAVTIIASDKQVPAGLRINLKTFSKWQVLSSFLKQVVVTEWSGVSVRVNGRVKGQEVSTVFQRY